MTYILPRIPRHESAPYAVYKNLFSPEECGAILALGVALGPQVAQIGSGSVGIVDPKKRISEVRWVNWHPTSEWLFSKLAASITTANQRFYGFHLSGMFEALQLTRYQARRGGKGHYGWHEDSADGGEQSFRKLSFIIPLNTGYKGGSLRLFHHAVEEQSQGTMIVFPSYKTHCVEPVTSGERWSLVGWVTGPAFI